MAEILPIRRKNLFNLSIFYFFEVNKKSFVISALMNILLFLLSEFYYVICSID